MSTLEDIGRLRDAEQEAQAIADQARDEVSRQRAETETKIAGISERAASDLVAMRERLQAESQAEAEALVRDAEARMAKTVEEITGRLEGRKSDAVKAVVEALVSV